MARIPALAALLALLPPVATGQTFIDRFNYPAGTLVPGYTEQRGDWTATGTAVKGQTGVTYQELTLDGINDTDCCAEVLATRDPASAVLQYAGPVVRHSGSGASATFFMLKVQDGSTPYTGWDSYWAYFYNGSSFQAIGLNGTIPVATPTARVRLQVTEVAAGVRVQIFIDTDLDGRWNITGEVTTSFGIGTSGRVGICGYQGPIVDDLKYFGATLAANGLPTIGTTVGFAGRGLPFTPYLAAASLGRSGFPAPGGGIIPLDFDWLFQLSLSTPAIFSGFSGFTAGDGGFTLSLVIPNLPSLAGGTIWISALTHNGISELEIAPDTQVTFL